MGVSAAMIHLEVTRVSRSAVFVRTTLIRVVLSSCKIEPIATEPKSAILLITKS